MSRNFFRSVSPLLVLSLALISSAGLDAQPTTPVGLMRDAYATLSLANHDYRGHRVQAMKQIEVAARLLSADIRGDGRGHIAQGVSDDQLRAARVLLEQARVGLAGKPLRHVNRAISQINMALRIR